MGRVIYIKNPSSGSHFRTLGGGSGESKPKPRTPRGGENTSPWYGEVSNDTYVAPSGARYKRPRANWNIHQPKKNKPDYGTHENSIPPSQIIENYYEYGPLWDDPHGVREFTGMELVIGLGGVAILSLFAPEITVGTIGLEGAAAFLTAAGFQGGATGLTSLIATGKLEITINDAPTKRMGRGGEVITEYHDIVSWLKGQLQ